MLMRGVIGSSINATAVLALVALIASCTPRPDPVAKENRTLGIKANLGKSGDFVQAFNGAIAAGSETQTVPLDWNQLETSPGKFEPSTNFLAIANQFYRAHNTPIHISIRPIHTNQKVVPVDLSEVPFDDPRMVTRFKGLLDWVASQVPQVEVASLSIGSEIDVYMWGDSARWKEWTNFYEAVVPHAREKFPGTLITSETTHSVFAGPDLERIRALHRLSDAVGVSYYPMEPGLTLAKSPRAVHADFDAVVAAIPEKPIMYYQIGYPSSPVLKSSPKQQAEFVRQAFRAWDRHANHIRLLNFQWMHETTPAGLDHFADYYEYDTEKFRAFLGSIGLQSWSGKPKPAWEVLAIEARARGFGATGSR